MTIRKLLILASLAGSFAGSVQAAQILQCPEGSAITVRHFGTATELYAVQDGIRYFNDQPPALPEGANTLWMSTTLQHQSVNCLYLNQKSGVVFYLSNFGDALHGNSLFVDIGVAGKFCHGNDDSACGFVFYS